MQVLTQNQRCFTTPRDTKPDSKNYHVEDSRPGSLYREHLTEYEITILRRYFIDQMRMLEPEWIKIFETSQKQRDLDTAVENCDNEFLARSINGWLDDIAIKGDFPSLHDRIYAT
jgi:hypothetical protein